MGKRKSTSQRRAPMQTPASAQPSRPARHAAPAVSVAKADALQPRPTPSDVASPTEGTPKPPAIPAEEVPPVEPTPAVPEPAPPVAIALDLWSVSGVAVRGMAHYGNHLPCQDSVWWCLKPRPILALSDGAGSALASHLGSAVLVRGMTRLLITLEPEVAAWLDAPEGSGGEETSAHWAKRLLVHAKGLLEDQAALQQRHSKDLRATLLLAVVGRFHAFWWQVGDGAIVAQTPAGLRCISDFSSAKGEYANQTLFVDSATFDAVQYGLIPSAELLGLALMSDGGAERLVAHDGSRVAGRLGSWLQEVVAGNFPPQRIAAALHEPEMWERTNGDDRSIILLARPASHDATKEQSDARSPLPG